MNPSSYMTNCIKPAIKRNEVKLSEKVLHVILNEKKKNIEYDEVRKAIFNRQYTPYTHICSETSIMRPPLGLSKVVLLLSWSLYKVEKQRGYSENEAENNWY